MQALGQTLSEGAQPSSHPSPGAKQNLLDFLKSSQMRYFDIVNQRKGIFTVPRQLPYRKTPQTYAVAALYVTVLSWGWHATAG